MIVSESEEATVEKHLLPPKRRWQALNDMLTFLVSVKSSGNVVCYFCVFLVLLVVLFFHVVSV